MAYDQNEVDDVVLALLTLTTHGDGPNIRAWKAHDWETLDRLHERGYISDPKSKAKSVELTPEGVKRAKHLFTQFFGGEA